MKQRYLISCALYSEAAVLEGMNAEHADPVQPGSDETFGR